MIHSCKRGWADAKISLTVLRENSGISRNPPLEHHSEPRQLFEAVIGRERKHRCGPFLDCLLLAEDTTEETVIAERRS